MVTALSAQPLWTAMALIVVVPAFVTPMALLASSTVKMVASLWMILPS